MVRRFLLFAASRLPSGMDGGKSRHAGRIKKKGAALHDFFRQFRRVFGLVKTEQAFFQPGQAGNIFYAQQKVGHQMES